MPQRLKICVLGLDSAAPEIVFQDERLTNLRRLMDAGVWGRLESVVPPITVPAWMCMCASQDPGSLGLYGFRNRADHSYDAFTLATSGSIHAPAIWDHLAGHGKKSTLVGVPPNYPPRRVPGASVGCFLTPDPAKNVFTHPPELQSKIAALVGDYPVDVKGFRTGDKDWLRREIFALSRKQWQVVHWLLAGQEWDYFHFVDIGLDRIHHGFWNFFDRTHLRYQPGNPYENVIPEYYRWLDSQIGLVMERLDADTALAVVSDHGAQRLDGGFCVNEWLAGEGLLALEEFPPRPTPFAELKVNWAKTKAWSEGGYCARIYFNVAGREPRGIVPAGDYAAFQDEMKARLEALTGPQGRPLDSLVFKPQEIYRRLRGVPPDLIVHFGGLRWRSIGSVGHGRLHVEENDTGPDGSNHAQFGAFILAAPNCPLHGEFQGARLLDIAPTLLDLAGYDIPASMQGRSLVAGMRKQGPGGLKPEEEKTIRDRLAGLGYL